jgi:hypothetical protein
MMFFIIILVGFALLTSSLNKSIYMRSINKKSEQLGHTILSIKNIERPEFLKEDYSFGPFIMGYGSSPTSFIYKEVIYNNNLNERKTCIVTIKKFLFFIVSIKYDFE